MAGSSEERVSEGGEGGWPRAGRFEAARTPRHMPQLSSYDPVMERPAHRGDSETTAWAPVGQQEHRLMRIAVTSTIGTRSTRRRQYRYAPQSDSNILLQ